MADVSNIQRLRGFLKVQTPGQISDRETVAAILADCWEEFEGSGATSMKADKLWRLETPWWKPPVLTFVIERHGQTVFGSTLATLCTWALDIDAVTASVDDTRRRQVSEKDKRLSTKPIAESLAEAILAGREDERLKALPDGSVKLDIGAIIPATLKETTSARRTRLRRDLSALLKPHGWMINRPNVYSKVNSQQQ